MLLLSLFLVGGGGIVVAFLFCFLFVCFVLFPDVVVVLTFHVYCSIIYHEFPAPASISSDR